MTSHYPIMTLLGLLLGAPSDAEAAQPWRFFLIGDSRTHPEILEQNIRTMVSLDSDAVLAFNAGDLTANGFASEWQRHVKALHDGSGGLVRTDAEDFGPWIRYFGAVGNHDVRNWFFWHSNWNKYLAGQKNLGVNTSKGIYFTLTYENAIFFVLDSQHPSRAQTQWLQDELKSQQAKDATWKIAVFHHPVYPCNDKDPFHKGLEWVQIFEENDFDLVHVAHSHTFERTCPMRGGQCADDGVVYLNSSGAGAPFREIKPDKVDMVSFNDREDAYDCSQILKASGAYWHFFCHVVVEGQRLDVGCYSHNDTNVMYDKFSLDKRQPTGCVDQDADGYGDPASPDCPHPERDCDDSNPNANPGIAESCPPPAPGDSCEDQDADGYGDPASMDCEHPHQDCDDSNPQKNPGIAGSCDAMGEESCASTPRASLSTFAVLALLMLLVGRCRWRRAYSHSTSPWALKTEKNERFILCGERCQKKGVGSD